MHASTHHAADLHDASPRAFTEWRPVDELVLTALAHTRAPVEHMAERLGRTTAEIEAQLELLGLA